MSTWMVAYTAPPKHHRTFACQVAARTRWGARRVFRRQMLLGGARILSVHRMAGR